MNSSTGKQREPMEVRLNPSLKYRAKGGAVAFPLRLSVCA
jgi:hypothetical protein